MTREERDEKLFKLSEELDQLVTRNVSDDNILEKLDRLDGKVNMVMSKLNDIEKVLEKINI
jgi:hypothetical protein